MTRMNQTKAACRRQWVRRWVFPALFLLAGGLPVAGPAAESSSPAARLELAGRPALGDAKAAVTVLEVSSFKCSHCRAFHEKTFPRLRSQYVDTGKVRWVVLNAADDPAEEYAKIFAIARCAQRQGKYWEILDELFRVAHRAPSFLEDAITRSPVIDRDELDLCLRDRTIRAGVADDFAQYAGLKLKGTPSFIVWKVGADGQRIETTIAGAQTLDYFQRVIDEMLKLP